MDKRAVLLVGGKGTRLKPYTVVLPKPLMPIGEYPILEVVIRQLVQHGFNRITMAVNHQAELIKAFFGDGEKWNVNIDYSLEDKPLSTIGPLKLIKDLPEQFLLMNGDVLTDLNFFNLFDEHNKRDDDFTIAGALRKETIEYGILETNTSSKLVGFKEKPKYEYLVSMGVYIMNKKLLEMVPGNTPYGFDNLMYDSIDNGKSVYVHQHNGYWMDIGRPDDYSKAIDDFDRIKEELIKGL